MKPFSFTSVLFATVFATVSLTSTFPQQQDQDVFRAFSPGQYAHDGQPVLRTAPRLVAIRQGTPVLRAVPGGTLKRVRVAHAPLASNYAVEPQLTAAPQQAYYVQRQPAAVAKQAHVVKPAARPVYQSQEEPEEYAPDPNPQYNFSFDVKDDDLTNYQNRQEERDGGVIKGSYSVVDPDGYVRTVTYTADPKNGFQAKVVREPTDVKVKFPVPTQAPEEQQQLYRAAKPSPVRAQQISQYPAHQQQYQTQQPQAVYSHPAYTQAQPTYVVRRIPGGAASVNQPRVVKVLRAQ
ncbi:unnamed protein product [Allacma fusca]|uniref:Cuticle protein n=1 Tax=Allacma fusca TaxID=39272 RepID=A0A8J2K6S0_9HEXA|nr:unnamed protein product [Allacma fusca]